MPFSFPSVKGFLLFALPLPLLPAAVVALGSGHPWGMLADGSAFGLYMLGALLTRRGLQGRLQAQERRYGPRPWLTPKNLGAGSVALATSIAAHFGAGHDIASSLAFAAVSVVGFHLLYGLDPIRAPRVRLPGITAEDRVTNTLAEAEGRILNIEQAAGSIGNPELRGRLSQIADQGREILALIERRPRDLRRARKFLTVYLEGAERVTQGYAATHRGADSRALEQNFRTVLITIEEVFAEQQKRLLETDVLDLDVQIEVLTKQLKREGIL